MVAAQDELDVWAIERTLATLTLFKQTNEAAQRFTDQLPPEVRATLEEHGTEIRGIIPALVACKPSVVLEAHAAIIDCMAALERQALSLSHPFAMMVAEPSDETTGNGAKVERDWQAEVERLEQRVARLEAMTRQLVASSQAAAGALSAVALLAETHQASDEAPPSAPARGLPSR